VVTHLCPLVVPLAAFDYCHQYPYRLFQSSR
jgi:hypothetical protein